MAPEEATYLVRGTVPDDPDGQRGALAEATARPEVVGVFADPVISTCLVCPGAPAVGSDQDVAAQLGVKALADAGMDGYRVPVAIVDTGINLAHLESKGRDPKFSRQRSWAPAGVATRPGQHPVGHGTMCAYDVGIAAPKATLVDHALLLSETPGETAMSGLLSDAVLSYSRLLGSVQAMPARDGVSRRPSGFCQVRPSVSPSGWRSVSNGFPGWQPFHRHSVVRLGGRGRLAHMPASTNGKEASSTWPLSE